jgi:dTDP-4-dehydrorhamnose reductase
LTTLRATAQSVAPSAAGALEMWGGFECTVSRVGDTYIDQLELTGHADRIDDIDRVASLGVRSVRYPLLWERIAPDGVDSADWSWADERLARLHAHGMTPVAGLMHHGSGPRDTSLEDSDLPVKLARYAHACARRYPWVEAFTPVNEPLTTARFSGLYAHWYPHHRDDRAFVRMLINECFAIRAAMRAIREVTPAARLVQTEDLGHVHASDGVCDQADFENERRWLTWDLLCGKVVRGHPMYAYLRQHGATARELSDLAHEPCPPNVIGIDHYVTSERYLDEDIDAYPPACRGGNGRDRYADVEVARVHPELRRGAAALLRETWQRYGIPIVVTEAYLSCDDERERVRWLIEMWNAAIAARSGGCDVRAVTAWALFGARGWDVLSTCNDGRYDAGAFDIAAGEPGVPAETALARAIRALAYHGWYDDETLAAPGWWQHTRAADSAAATGATDDDAATLSLT